MGIARWHDPQQWAVFIDEKMDLLHDLSIVSTLGPAKTFWRAYFDVVVAKIEAALTRIAEKTLEKTAASLFRSSRRVLERAVLTGK